MGSGVLAADPGGDPDLGTSLSGQKGRWSWWFWIPHWHLSPSASLPHVGYMALGIRPAALSVTMAGCVCWG